MAYSNEVTIFSLAVVFDEFGHLVLEKKYVDLKRLRDILDKEFPEFDRIDDLMAALRDTRDELNDAEAALTMRYGALDV